MSATSRAQWAYRVPAEMMEKVQWHFHWIIPQDQVPPTRIITHPASGTVPAYTERYSAIEDYGVSL